MLPCNPLAAKTLQQINALMNILKNLGCGHYQETYPLATFLKWLTLPPDLSHHHVIIQLNVLPIYSVFIL